MDASQALADLIEISSQVEAAVLFGEDGVVQGSTVEDSAAAERLARAGERLLVDAAAFHSGDAQVTQVEVATSAGSVFVVRDGDRRIAATTAADPTVGLVFYDLKSCLRNAGAEPEQPRRRRRTKQEPVDGET